MKNYLILCNTPLQVLIAENIVKEFNGSWSFLMISNVKNKKFDLYYSKLSSIVSDSSYFYYKTHSKYAVCSSIFDFLKIIDTYRNKSFDGVFLASIDNFYNQLVLSKINFNELRTFDDGSANINQSSCYFIESKKSFLGSLLNVLMMNKYSLNKIKDLSRLHYTIFPNLPNIISNHKFISLKNTFCNEEIKIESKENLNFFLGQPFEEFDLRLDIIVLNRLFKELSIDYYFQHPRELESNYCVNMVQSNFIFEDYLQTFLELNSNCKVKIYSFFSTAAFNVSSFKNVECIFIYDDFLKNKYLELFEMSKSFGDTFKVKI